MTLEIDDGLHSIPNFYGYFLTKRGLVFSIKRGRLKPRKLNITQGYYKVLLWRDGKRYNFTIHRLMRITFMGNQDPALVVNHLDGIKTNNLLNNLELCSHKENSQHAAAMGLYKTGSSNSNSKLKERDIINIRAMLERGILQKDIALLFKVSQRTISQIKLGQTWAVDKI